MTARRIAVSLVLAGQVAVAGVVLGLPDLAAAADFLRGGYPTGADVTAASSLLLWAVLVGAVAVHVAWMLRRAARTLALERVRLGAVLTVGFVILAGGVLRHTQPSYSMCCGSVTEAQQAARSAP